MEIMQLNKTASYLAIFQTVLLVPGFFTGGEI